MRPQGRSRIPNRNCWFCAWLSYSICICKADLGCRAAAVPHSGSFSSDLKRILATFNKHFTARAKPKKTSIVQPIWLWLTANLLLIWLLSGQLKYQLTVKPSFCECSQPAESQNDKLNRTPCNPRCRAALTMGADYAVRPAVATLWMQCLTLLSGRQWAQFGYQAHICPTKQKAHAPRHSVIHDWLHSLMDLLADCDCFCRPSEPNRNSAS